MDELKRVFENYGADLQVLEQYDCVPLDAKIIRDAILIQTSVGTRVLKRVSMKKDRLSYVHRALEHAFSKGMANVPRLIKNHYGDAFTIHRSGLYYLTAWDRGREADFGQPGELLAGARLLRRWHDTMNSLDAVGIESPIIPSTRDRLNGMYRDFLSAKEMVSATTSRSPFARGFESFAEKIETRCKLAFQAMDAAGFDGIEQAARAKGQMCHGSFHHHTAQFVDGNLTVVNYDSVHPGLPSIDLAWFCHWYMPLYEWDANVLIEVWHAYQGGEANRIEDLRMMNVLLTFPLRTLELISRYHRHDQPSNDNDYFDSLRACLRMEAAKGRAQKALQSLMEPTVQIAVAVPVANLDGDWTVATFALNESHDDEIDALQIKKNNLESESDDSPAVAKTPSVHPAKRKTRRQRQHLSGFQPKVPGLSLWRSNEHHGKDNE